VVVLTADTTRSKLERLVAAGARGCMTKPLDVARFLELIDQTLADAG
jgi:DNA-binding NarL/FixJ family response regulator